MNYSNATAAEYRKSMIHYIESVSSILGIDFPSDLDKLDFSDLMDLHFAMSCAHTKYKLKKKKEADRDAESQKKRFKPKL